MKHFIDAEFMEDGRTIDLLSLAIVAEDGRELYAINTEADTSKANDFVRDMVLPHLRDEISAPESGKLIKMAGPHLLIASQVLDFIGDRNTPGFEKPEFWGYYSAYDWVVFCQLFGRMVDLPKGWPMFCNDIKQWCKAVGDPQLPVQARDKEHHALLDARWNKVAYEFLRKHEAKIFGQ